MPPKTTAAKKSPAEKRSPAEKPKKGMPTAKSIEAAKASKDKFAKVGTEQGGTLSLSGAAAMLKKNPDYVYITGKPNGYNVAGPLKAVKDYLGSKMPAKGSADYWDNSRIDELKKMVPKAPKAPKERRPRVVREKAENTEQKLNRPLKTDDQVVYPHSSMAELENVLAMAKNSSNIEQLTRDGKIKVSKPKGGAASPKSKRVKKPKKSHVFDFLQRHKEENKEKNIKKYNYINATHYAGSHGRLAGSTTNLVDTEGYEGTRGLKHGYVAVGPKKFPIISGDSDGYRKALKELLEDASEGNKYYVADEAERKATLEKYKNEWKEMHEEARMKYKPAKKPKASSAGRKKSASPKKSPKTGKTTKAAKEKVASPRKKRSTQ